MKYFEVKKPLKSKIFLIFCKIRSDIFHPRDMFCVSKKVRIYPGTLLYQYQSKQNPNRGSNTIYSLQNFTKSEITFFSFNTGFQALQFHKIWPKCTRNLLTDPLNNSVNWVYASGHLCLVFNLKMNFRAPVHCAVVGCSV